MSNALFVKKKCQILEKWIIELYSFETKAIFRISQISYFSRYHLS